MNDRQITRNLERLFGWRSIEWLFVAAIVLFSTGWWLAAAREFVERYVF
jgi:hypothetical protein